MSTSTVAPGEQNPKQQQVSTTSSGGGGAVVGSLSGSRTPSGNIVGLEAKGSFEQQQQKDKDVIAPSSTRRSRMYSEEDEEIRRAKQMALAIAQHPGVSDPDEIRALVEEQEKKQQPEIAKVPSRLLPGSSMKPNSSGSDAREDSFANDSSGSISPPSSSTSFASSAGGTKKRSTVKSTVKNFQESIRTSQKKAKERLQGMVGHAPHGSGTATIAAAAAVGDSHVPNEATRHFKSPPSPETAIRIKMGSPFRNLLPGNNTKAVSPPSLSPQPSTEETPTETNRVRKWMAEHVGAATPKIPSSQEAVRLAGIVWKRRSGLGKLSATKAWERRRIILQGSKLIYFYHDKSSSGSVEQDDEEGEIPAEVVDVVATEKKTTWLEQTAMNWGMTGGSHEDPSTPRGVLDLVKERATVAAALGHSGAPTPFALSIKIKGDTYWKICYDSHPELMQWLAALTDVVVTSSVDQYNAQLLAVADPSNEALFPHGHAIVQPPPAEKPTDEHEGGHRLWMTGKYTVSSPSSPSGCGDDGLAKEPEAGEAKEDVTLVKQDKEHMALTDEKEEVASPSIQAHSDEPVSEFWILRDKDVYAMVVIVNIALVYSHSMSTSAEGFWYAVTFANLGLWYCLAKEEEKRKRKPGAKMATAVGRSSSDARKGISSDVDDGGPTTSDRDMSKTAAATAKPRAAGRKRSAFKPVAGTTTVKIENPSDPPVNDKNEVFGGWRARSGEVLKVRSHGYLSTKQKIPSPGELYECSHVDIFESPNRYPDMAPRVKLPEVQFDDEGPKTWRAPDLFVVSVSLPTDPPKLRGSSSDGGGYTITMYFTMKRETRDILRRVTADSYDPSKEPTPADVQTSKVNAVKLFEEWCRRAPTDAAFQARFKLVAEAQNLKEIGMPNWIAKYNGKPVLIKRAGQTGFLFTHPELNAIEFDISFHPFPYLAKQAICYMKEHFFKKVVVTFGFVIEGRSDDELPECLIGLMQLCYPDPVHAIQAQDFFDGSSIKSF